MKISPKLSCAGRVFAAFVFVIPGVSFARIGETVEQCADRYGEPVATVETRLAGSDEGALRFVKDDVGVTVELKGGKAWLIRYERRYISEDLLQSLLRANVDSGVTVWKGPLRYDDKRFWMSADKELHAMFTPLQGGAQLMVLSGAALEAMEEEREEMMDRVGTAEAEEWVEKFYGAPSTRGF